MLSRYRIVTLLLTLSFLASCAPPKVKNQVLDQISAVTACKQLNEEIRTIQYIDTINNRRIMFNVERSSNTIIYASSTQNCVLTSAEETEAIIARFKGVTVCIDKEESETEKPNVLVISTLNDGFAAEDPDDTNVQLIGQTFAEFQSDVDSYSRDYEALGAISGARVDSPGTINCSGEGSEF